jgi:hypothetical protein
VVIAMTDQPAPAPLAKATITTVTVTIAAGEALSSAADLSTGDVVMLLMPVDWSPANVSFQISEDNVTYRDLYDASGVEVLRPVGANRALNVDPGYTSGSLWVKVRSGSHVNPVNQAASRDIVLVIQ